MSFPEFLQYFPSFFFGDFRFKEPASASEKFLISYTIPGKQDDVRTAVTAAGSLCKDTDGKGY